ncbi:MAG: hypothetical protein V1934_02410 [Methanobacteriota archaeon]
MAEDEEAGTLAHWSSQGKGTTEQTLVLPKLWLGLAVPLAFALETTAFFLYSALELDWSTFDSWWGLVIIMGAPVVAGAGIGLAFENMKRAIVTSWAVGLSASISTAVLFAIPYTIDAVESTGRHTGLAWTAGFVAALAILPLGAIGAALAVSANNIE